MKKAAMKKNIYKEEFLLGRSKYAYMSNENYLDLKKQMEELLSYEKVMKSHKNSLTRNK